MTGFLVARAGRPADVLVLNDGSLLVSDDQVSCGFVYALWSPFLDDLSGATTFRWALIGWYSIVGQLQDTPGPAMCNSHILCRLGQCTG